MKTLGSPTRSHSRRNGFSLMEIIMATAILMASVVVLARLAGMGRSTAQKADLQANAQRICEQTMNEIVLGERPLQTVERSVLQPIGAATFRQESSGDDAVVVQTTQTRWLHSVIVTPLAEMPELVRVTVSVEPDKSLQPGEQPIETETDQRRDRFALSRWVRKSNGTSDGFEFAGGVR